MSDENAWEEIKQSLQQLSQNDALTSSQSFLLKLQHWADTEQYSLEIFKAFINIFQYMSADIQTGQSINTLLEQAISGTYVQPGWDVHAVYQANGDIFNFIFNQFREDIAPKESGILIPVILLVMNNKEAEALDSGVAFQNHHNELHDDFQQLKTLLVEHKINWLNRYKALPEEWQPFLSDENTMSIKQIMKEALSLVEGCTRPLIPHFIDIRTLNNSENRPKKYKFGLRKLRDGCIVIMDIISMRHPQIQREFRKSLLDAFPNTLVAAIYPIPPSHLGKLSQTMILIEQYTELEFYKRHKTDRDLKCDEINEKFRLERWIQELQQFLPNKVKMNTTDPRTSWDLL
ncbi:hypothetical protein PN36_19315 [Candidatus Thiomargarita nelsonii]|uniref:Uncharacterized protein n=1 Tax=Candidatus Thiomargarita nelsonii TaxID=1003181 RepID=A0A0A6PD02_9GAMM|nr:hypothetical protein PN36_19315 [Candidatus Thiomargarita nelsonii]